MFELIIASICTITTIIGFVYAIARNFKIDICGRIDKMENRIDILEERMFWMATGRRLEDVIKEERINRK
jgi:hypothetical protein